MRGFPTRSFGGNGNIQADLKELSSLLPSLRAAGAINNVWYIDANNGSDGNNDGKSWDSAFATFSALNSKLQNNDVIYLSGLLREHWTAPVDVFDVTIIGVAGRHRQASDGGVATGGGATWLDPDTATATTPLLELREQGWTIYNIFFNHTDEDAACIKLNRQEISAAMDASHTSIIGCRFGGGDPAIEDYGGHSNILIKDCVFHDCDYAIRVTNQGIAIPNKWLVEDCEFRPCTNGIVGAWVESVFRNNMIWKMTTTTINAASGNTGLRNMFWNNMFNIAAADFDPAGGVTGNATDVWHSILSDAIEQGQPAN
jgi:hypothetical protein